MVIENYKPVQIANLKTIHLSIQQQLFTGVCCSQQLASKYQTFGPHLYHNRTTTEPGTEFLQPHASKLMWPNTGPRGTPDLPQH